MGRLERDLSLELRRADSLGVACMQPFTFHLRTAPARPARRPRSSSRAPSADGPCLFVTDDQLIEPRPGQRCGSTRCRRTRTVAVSARSRPTRRARPCSRRSRRGAAAGVASVVGFGGGSPMDVAKLAAYLLGSGDDLDEIWGVERRERAAICRWSSSRPPPAPGRKSPRSRSSPSKAAPSWRSMPARSPPISRSSTPTLTVGLPRHVTAATGIDAIVHAVEAYTSARLKNPLSDLLAIEALRLLSANLAARLRPARRPRRALGDAARRAPCRGRLFQRAGRRGPCLGLPARRASPSAARPVQRADAAPRARSIISEAARELYAELAPIIDPNARGTAARPRARC